MEAVRSGEQGLGDLRKPWRGARFGVELSSQSASPCASTTRKPGFRGVEADNWITDSQSGRWPLVPSQH